MKNRKKSAHSIFVIITLFFLTIYVFSLILPLVCAFMTSFKGNIAYLADPLGFPKKWIWRNVITAVEYFTLSVKRGGELIDIYVGRMFLYSMLYALGSAIINAFVCCVTAYATARFNFHFNAVVYGIVVFTMTLPIVGNLPSELQLLKTLNIYDHIWGIWICKANFLGLYYLVFFSAFKAMPKDYSEAAYIDGASNAAVMFRIALPLISGTFFTVVLILFVGFWNDYMVTITYLPSYPGLAYGLYEYSTSTKPAINNTPMKLAGCYILIVPILIIFLIFKDKLMGNISMGGIKE